MYTIGSLADLISGKNTPNKTKVEIKEVKSKPFKSKSKDTTPVVKSPKVKKSSPKNDTVKEITEMPFKKRKSSDGKKKQAKKFKVEKEQVEKEQESTKEVSENAKNAIKRMRDRKKERHIDPEVDKRTIFVGNLPISSKKKQILQHFSKYGKIKSMRFRCLARADLSVPKKTAFITKQFHPNATTLNCYINFEEEQSCKDALESNGTIFKGNHLRVDLVQRSKDHDQKIAIFVGNLPFDAKDEDLWKVFEDCGKIESVRIVRDGLTMVGKGYGYVNFNSIDSVELALQMTDVKVKNRVLRILRANSNPKSNKKRNEKGEKVRKVPRKKKPEVKAESTEETENDNNENSEADTTLTKKKKTTGKSFQGVKFTDKKKKKKTNKGELKKKKLSKMLTNQA